MRRYGIAILLLCLFVLWLVLVAYLAGMEPEPRGVPRINVGIIHVPGPAGQGSFSLEDTNRLIARLQPDLPNETMEKEIHLIQGRNVDEYGNASSWLYGIVSENRTAIAVYDRTGWTVIPWNRTLPDTPIDPDAIVPLGRLFLEHPDLGARPPGVQRQVELFNSTYRVTVSNQTATEIYTFDAVNGALIETHEE